MNVTLVTQISADNLCTNSQTLNIALMAQRRELVPSPKASGGGES